MDTRPDSIFEFISKEHAEEQQRLLSNLVKCETEPGFNPTLICGLDAAYRDREATAVAAVWNLTIRETVELGVLCKKAPLDYIPGLFGFREGKLLAEAVETLESTPDVFLVDGHGRAHPRRFGLACHVGLHVDKPTIGIAKSHFYGTIDNEQVIDSDGEILGSVLAGKAGSPRFVSVGHRICLEHATRLVRECSVNNYPVPLRIAHMEAAWQRQELRG